MNLEELTDQDAQSDGFATLQALQDVLKSLYPDTHEDGKQWFKVKFCLDAARADPTGPPVGAPATQPQLFYDQE